MSCVLLALHAGRLDTRGLIPCFVILFQGTKLWIIMEYLGGGSALDLVSYQINYIYIYIYILLKTLELIDCCVNTHSVKQCCVDAPLHMCFTQPMALLPS